MELDQHQLTSITFQDRYPELFAAANKYSFKIFDNETVSILSFGCSTGEECVSLKNYFSNSKIIGADINLDNLQIAESKNSHPDIKYIYSSTNNLTQNGKYHLIFCLSVLCRWRDTELLNNCKEVYPFEKFDEAISILVSLLHESGLLIIYNSNFRFEDTKAYEDFEILKSPTVLDSGFVYKFDKENNRFNGKHINCIYQKKR